MILYHKGNLFNLTPENNFIAHSCNCQGVWGAGIAKQFAELYPEAYEEYKELCVNVGNDLIGRSFILKDSIICMATSRGYDDSEFEILRNTQRAIEELMLLGIDEVWISKSNIELFEVPWRVIETILNKFPEIIFNVCSLED